jgi:hypothetical protein
MTDCLSTEMRDALPDLIHRNLGAARMSEVEAHVASCAECAAELELLRAVLASAPAAPPIDVKRIVTALPVAAKKGFLLHRGNGESLSAPSVSLERSGSAWSRPALRVAAAIAVVAAGGLSLLVGREVLNPEAQVGHGAGSVAATSAPVPDADSATGIAPAVTRVAESSPVDVPAVGASSGLLLSEVQQLSDEHLVALLSEMDSIDAVPAAEPEIIAPAFADADTSAGTE